MGYFSNGTEGEVYRERFCDHCIHGNNCVIWNWHLIDNYKGANDDDYYLHKFIPLIKDGVENGKCLMFYDAKAMPGDAR